MAYDAIVNGASGILFYQDRRYREIDPRVAPVSQELSSIQHILASPTVESSVQPTDERIRVLAKQHDSSQYVIVVNRSSENLTAKLETKTPNGEWTFLDNKEKVAKSGSHLQFDMEPWGVRILTSKAGK